MAILTRRSFTVAAAVSLAAARAMAQTQAQAGPTRVRLQTDQGVIVAELADDKAPITVANFLHYVDTGRYDGAVFYRASHSPGAPTIGLIEGGIKDGAKLFPPIAHESTLATGLHHLDGTLSMARFEPGTATSDFSVCCGDAPYLDAHPELPGDNVGYAAFGHVVEGMEIVRAILAMPTGGPADNPEMKNEMLLAPVKIVTARRA